MPNYYPREMAWLATVVLLSMFDRDPNLVLMADYWKPYPKLVHLLMVYCLVLGSKLVLQRCGSRFLLDLA